MMRRVALALTAATALLSAGLITSTPAGGAPPPFEHLDPGGLPQLQERLPVNVVFVGYRRADIDRSAFRGMLAERYEPIVRSRAFYGIEEKLGIEIEYDYRVRFAGRRYEDRFFSRLERLARLAPLTDFQQQYNDQQGNVRDVRDNHHIDAASVERWLGRHAPSGVDTRRNTVYFVNWFGRPDFKFHVYTKTDEPDPDTGYNFGEQRESRKLIAWGGTTANDEESGLGVTRRVWFHDLSAGPESWGGSWNVDDADLDGDGEPDYRIPPAWEYRPGGYRPRTALTGDLAKLTRYVALDLLFTTSPLYPVELPTEEPPETVNLDSNTYEGWAGVNASEEYITRDLLTSELRELLDRNKLSYDNQDLPYSGAAKRCYLLWLREVSCYPELGYPPFANLFLQNSFQLRRTRDDAGRVDYELPIFNYAAGAGEGAPFLGFADDNYRTGTQSYVFTFISPDIVELGYGLTTTMIHEVGHHVGLSHPHDGYDSASGIDFEPTGDFYFAWAGDESNTMMSYIDLNWDFSQFDQDNMDRFQTAALIEAANRLAAKALNSNRPRRADDELRRADRLVGQAERAFADHRYTAARVLADRAYDQATQGAREAGVDVQVIEQRARLDKQAARQASSVHQPGEFIDTLEDGPRNQP